MPCVNWTSLSGSPALMTSEPGHRLEDQATSFTFENLKAAFSFRALPQTFVTNDHTTGPALFALVFLTGFFTVITDGNRSPTNLLLLLLQQ